MPAHNNPDIGKLAKELEELKVTQARFRDIAQSMSDWVWEVDKDGKYIFVAGKVEETLGYRPAELIGKTPFDFMPPEEAKRIGAIFQEIIASKKPITDLKNTNLTKAGKKILLLTNGVPVLDNEGNLLGYRGVDKDITNTKKEDEKFKLIFDNAPDAYFLINLKGKILDVNDAGTKLLGAPKDKLLGTNFTKMAYLDAAGLKKALKIMAELAMGRSSIPSEYTIRTMDNRTIPIEASNHIIKLDNRRVILATVRDISERKKIAESERQYQFEIQKEKSASQNYLDIAGVMIIALDTEGNIIEINKKGCEILGYPREEILGKNWLLTFIPKTNQQAITNLHMRVLSENKDSYRHQNHVQTKAGPRLIAWNNTIIKNEHGGVTGTLSSGEDITEKFATEQKAKKHFAQLERLNKLMVGRELKMKELKAKINALEQAK